jgi:hypothetical protein
MQNNTPLILLVMVLAAGLTISLSRDLSRALRWFLRTLFRVGTGVLIIVLCYAALYGMDK